MLSSLPPVPSNNQSGLSPLPLVLLACSCGATLVCGSSRSNGGASSFPVLVLSSVPPVPSYSQSGLPSLPPVLLACSCGATLACGSSRSNGGTSSFPALVLSSLPPVPSNSQSGLLSAALRSVPLCCTGAVTSFCLSSADATLFSILFSVSAIISCGLSPATLTGFSDCAGICFSVLSTVCTAALG